MNNKTKKKILFFLIILVVCFSPFTISRLFSSADETALLEQDPKYQQLEQELSDLEQQEQQLKESLPSDENINQTETPSPAEGEAISVENPQIDQTTQDPGNQATDSQTSLPDGSQPRTTDPVSTPIDITSTEGQQLSQTSPLIDPVPSTNLALIPSPASSTNVSQTPSQAATPAEPVSVEPTFDPLTAPGNVSFHIKLENGQTPNFSVKAKFVAVGGKIYESQMNQDGTINISLTSGRYYAEFDIEDKDHKLKDNGPAFFLQANQNLDLGEYFLQKIN